MAGRQSTIQASPHLRAIESAILDGVSMRQIASRYGVSPNAVHRHAQGVVKPAIAKSQVGINNANGSISDTNEQLDKAGQIALIRQSGTAALIEKRFADYERVMGKAEAKDDLAAWGGLARVELQALRLRAELSGELVQQAASTTQILVLMPPQPSSAPADEGLVIDAETP